MKLDDVSVVWLAGQANEMSRLAALFERDFGAVAPSWKIVATAYRQAAAILHNAAVELRNAEATLTP